MSTPSQNRRTGRGPADPWKTFETYLQSKKLRVTDERRTVLDTILSRQGHFDAEELLQFLRKRKKTVSRATLYRTLDHLILAGLVLKHTFGRGHAQYEYVFGRKHHDHMVCDRCGTVIEFINEEIEALQEEVCERHDFLPTNHVMEIFGLCRDCRQKKR